MPRLRLMYSKLPGGNTQTVLALLMPSSFPGAKKACMTPTHGLPNYQSLLGAVPSRIAELSEFVRSCTLERRKLVGICFGHQLIAHALGGHTSKSEKGWGLGLQEFDITTQKPWMDPVLNRCALYFSHQDQVTALPVGADLLGGSDFCPNAMYCIGDQVLGIQGHPEISQSLMIEVIERRKEQVGSKVYSDALNSLNNGTPDARTVARWIINFINL